MRCRELNKVVESHETMTNDEIASELARTLDERHQLLKLLAMNHYDMEENSRIELLVEFKESYGNALRAVLAMLTKFRPDMSIEEKQTFVYTFSHLCLEYIHIQLLQKDSRRLWKRQE